MMKKILLLIFLIYSLPSFAQPSDILVLKRKGKTVKSFFAGSQIEFTTIFGVYKNAMITRIHNDSIFLQEFIIRQLPTTLRTYITDTAGSYRYQYFYKDIATMGEQRKKGFSLAASGSALMSGGILLVVASGVIYVVERDLFSWKLAAASAALAGIGYLLSKQAAKGIVIGKRGYSFEYMDMTP